MPTTSPKRSTGFNSAAWIVIAAILTGGLFVFLWLALVARRVLPRPTHTILWLLPLGAMLWVGGATFMARGALAPTIPGETGNPQFLAGFILATICLVLMVVFNNIFTRALVKDGKSAPIHARVVGFTICAVGFLLSQLIDELTPVAPQNHDILALFQFLCIMVGAVVGIQWVERVHATYIAITSTSLTATAPSVQPGRAPQRL